ncbi:MAG: hypothetical protein II821_08715 [Treponema sp.]|nr:hypothetical protein [Treponema sp.]
MKFKRPFFFTFLLLIFSYQISALEFSARLLPAYGITFSDEFDSALGGTLSLDFSTFNLRKRDEVYFSLQASPFFLSAEGLDRMKVYDFDFAAGYNYRISDRLSASLEGYGGIWFFPEDSDLELESTSGISLGARLSGNFYISPTLKASLFTGYKSYYTKPENFFSTLELGLGISINLTKVLSSSTGIAIDNYETESIFPIFYARYDENSFGQVSFTNIEKTDITDIEVSVFIEQFMSAPKVIASYDRIKPGENFDAKLTAFFNEGILSQLQNKTSEAELTVTYKNLGSTTTFRQTLPLQTLTRNSMSWKDDRQAAAFISAKDGAAERFARQITLALKDTIGQKAAPNHTYAKAVYEVLKSYGINYVLDPSSVFSTSDVESIDFLQFPYQTLLYYGGDCDDLSILNCSMLEALGVSTALITIPGHIYMAYDSGVSKAEAERIFGSGKFVHQNGKNWIPLEITVPQDSFDLAMTLGIRQWNKYPKERLLLPVEEAWKEYKPVTVPGSDISVPFPSRAVKKFN